MIFDCGATIQKKYKNRNSNQPQQQPAPDGRPPAPSMVVSRIEAGVAFAYKWGVRKDRKTVESFRVNVRVVGSDDYSDRRFVSVKLAWLLKDWGLPEVYDTDSQKFCKEIVQKKLDEDVESFKDAALPHWKRIFGGIDDDRALFTVMLSEKKFFVSAAAVELWNNVSL